MFPSWLDWGSRLQEEDHRGDGAFIPCQECILSPRPNAADAMLLTWLTRPVCTCSSPPHTAVPEKVAPHSTCLSGGWGEVAAEQLQKRFRAVCAGHSSAFSHFCRFSVICSRQGGSRMFTLCLGWSPALLCLLCRSHCSSLGHGSPLSWLWGPSGGPHLCVCLCLFCFVLRFKHLFSFWY